MARTKTNTWNSTKHAQQQDVTYIKNKVFLYFLDCSIFINTFYLLDLQCIYQEMLSYCLSTVNDFHGGGWVGV